MSASREKRFRSELRESGAENPALKKKQRQQGFRRAIAATIAVALILGLAVLFVIGTGAIPANISALKVDGVKITPAELNYHYINMYNYEYTYGSLQYYQYYSIADVSNPFALGGITYTEDMTLKDYLLDKAKTNVTIAVVQSEKAKASGMTLSAENQTQLDDNLRYIEQLADANRLSDKKVLENIYGRGMTMNGYRKSLERALLSQQYADSIYDSYQRSDEDLENYYSENREKYDFVTYHSYSFDRILKAAEGEEEPTEEALAAYDAEQKAKAEELLGKIKDGETFDAVSSEYTPAAESDETEEDAAGDDEAEDESAEGDEESTGDDAAEDEATGDDEATDDETDDTETEEEYEDKTLKSELKLSEVTNEDLKAYLLDTARKEGDKTIIESENEYMVILFVDRIRYEQNMVEVRHILVSNEETTAEAAHSTADEILTEWKNGDATEDSFAALANEKSKDTGSNKNGGLYENVYKGQMVPTFDAWCFDPARKPGDTGLVDTEYGTHVIYFLGETQGDINLSWEYLVKTDMDNEEYSEHQAALTEAANVKENGFGMSFAA